MNSDCECLKGFQKLEWTKSWGYPVQSAGFVSESDRNMIGTVDWYQIVENLECQVSLSLVSICRLWWVMKVFEQGIMKNGMF